MRGMKEVYHDWPIYRYMIKSIREQVEHDGFSRVLPLVVENADTFQKSLGLQSDIVLKEMYNVSGPNK